MESKGWAPSQELVIGGIHYSFSIREGAGCYWGRWQCPICRLSETSADTSRSSDEALRSVIASLGSHHRDMHEFQLASV